MARNPLPLLFLESDPLTNRQRTGVDGIGPISCRFVHANEDSGSAKTAAGVSI
jgi:hypothetical protein